MVLDKETKDNAVILYDYPISYNCQIIRLVLCEKDLPGKTIRVDIGPMMEQLQPWFIRLNPSGQVPVLLHKDNIVTQTVEILNYLDQNFSEIKLIPSSEEDRSEMERWIVKERAFPEADFTYGLVERGTGKIVAKDMERRKRLIEKYLAINPDLNAQYESKLKAIENWQMRLRNPDLVDQLVDQLHEMLDELEKQVAGREFIVSNNYTIADAVWTTFLARLEMVGFKRMWSFGARPNIEKYYMSMKRRPSFVRAPIYLKSSLWLVVGSAIKAFRWQISAFISIGLLIMFLIFSVF